jgi:integrase/recombinase XerD
LCLGVHNALDDAESKVLRARRSMRVTVTTSPGASLVGVSICNRNRIMTGLRFLFRVTLRRLDLAAEIYPHP